MTPLPQRVIALDALRGLVMTLMVAEILHLPRLAAVFPGNPLAGMIAFHTQHVEWQGCSLHDLIQPGFSFLVGAALPFSLAARQARGGTFWPLFGHALWRSLLLILLGIFLRSTGRAHTNFTFEDTLTQIGLGYPFLFLLGFVSWRWMVAALLVILAGYGLFFALAPLPPPDFDYASVGVPATWSHHYSGFLAHWNKNSNAAWGFDRWFLNLFPRPKPFSHNGGGYTTLSFIPTLGTMVLGLLTGLWLRTDRSARGKFRGLVTAGVLLLLLALALQFAGVNPIVKRIWTPAFTFYSAGWVLLILSALYLLIEILAWKKWAFPLLVVGMNSIAIYVIVHTTERFFLDAVKRHLPFLPDQPLAAGAIVMAIWFAILLWMHRSKIYIRI